MQTDFLLVSVCVCVRYTRDGVQSRAIERMGEELMRKRGKFQAFSIDNLKQNFKALLVLEILFFVCFFKFPLQILVQH